MSEYRHDYCPIVRRLNAETQGQVVSSELDQKLKVRQMYYQGVSDPSLRHYIDNNAKRLTDEEWEEFKRHLPKAEMADTDEELSTQRRRYMARRKFTHHLPHVFDDMDEHELAAAFRGAKSQEHIEAAIDAASAKGYDLTKGAVYDTKKGKFHNMSPQVRKKALATAVETMNNAVDMGSKDGGGGLPAIGGLPTIGGQKDEKDKKRRRAALAGGAASEEVSKAVPPCGSVTHDHEGIGCCGEPHHCDMWHDLPPLEWGKARQFGSELTDALWGQAHEDSGASAFYNPRTSREPVQWPVGVRSGVAKQLDAIPLMLPRYLSKEYKLHHSWATLDEKHVPRRWNPYGAHKILTLSEAGGVVEGIHSRSMGIAHFTDGRKAFIKNFKSLNDKMQELAGAPVGPYHTPKHATDTHLPRSHSPVRAIAAARAMKELGLRVPEHHFNPESHELVTEGVEGVPALMHPDEDIEAISYEKRVRAAAIRNLFGDRDGHSGNWIITPDGEPVPIDLDTAGNKSMVHFLDPKLSRVSLEEQEALRVHGDDVRAEARRISTTPEFKRALRHFPAKDPHFTSWRRQLSNYLKSGAAGAEPHIPSTDRFEQARQNNEASRSRRRKLGTEESNP